MGEGAEWHDTAAARAAKNGAFVRDLSRAEARRIVLNFADERVEILPEPTRSRPQNAAARPREHRGRRTRTATRGSPSDDPSEPHEDDLGLWDDPAGVFTESALGFADQLAQDLASFGEDLARYTALLEDARQGLSKHTRSTPPPEA